MPFEALLFEIRGGIAYITLNRPVNTGVLNLYAGRLEAARSAPALAPA